MVSNCKDAEIHFKRIWDEFPYKYERIGYECPWSSLANNRSTKADDIPITHHWKQGIMASFDIISRHKKLLTCKLCSPIKIAHTILVKFLAHFILFEFISWINDNFILLVALQKHTGCHMPKTSHPACNENVFARKHDRHPCDKVPCNNKIPIGLDFIYQKRVEHYTKNKEVHIQTRIFHQQFHLLGNKPTQDRYGANLS